MAVSQVVEPPRVITEAIALQRLLIGGHMELQMVEEVDPEDPEKTIQVEREVEVQDWAEPGDVIDVSHWAHLDSYVRRGQITLITPDIEVKVNKAKEVAARQRPRKEVSDE